MDYPRDGALPDWTFSGREVAMSVYEVVGHDTHGRRVLRRGYHDPQPLLEQCKRAAQNMGPFKEEPDG